MTQQSAKPRSDAAWNGENRVAQVSPRRMAYAVAAARV